ncbi:auxin-binding protein T92 isoform X2 [Nicotiana tabacum]|uniref:Auxin-binding protein T92 isoform X2 n=2 Tax=Nicotiana tabacum TaxID=4097 RepID=A0AC58RRA9_TOBAC|nr:PREDICTED: uncharacterized protein LOC107822859 isoform X2 [Nicotiana tabacum]
MPQLCYMITSSQDIVFKEHLFPFAKSSSLHPFNIPARGSISFEHEPLYGHADHTLEPLQTPVADHASKCEVDTTTAIHEAHENDEVDAVCEEGNIVDAVVSEEGNIADAVISEEASEPQQATYDEHTENVVPECVSSGIRSQEPRRSGRSTKEHIWLQDYVTKKKAHNVALYPISDYLCYDQLSQACKSFVAKVSALTEPHNFT